MRKTSLSILAIGLTIAGFAQVELIDQPTPEALFVKAKETGKNIMIIGCAEWCLPCKVLKEEHFKNPDVSKYLKENFIVADYDMEKGIGIEFGKKYAVAEYPTLVLLNSNGELIDRIIGAFINDSIFYKALVKINLRLPTTAPGVTTNFKLEYPEFYATFFEKKTKRRLDSGVVEQYLDAQKNLLTEVNWRVIMMADLSKKYEKYFWENFGDYNRLYGQEAKSKISSLVNKKLNEAIAAKDVKAFQALKQFLVTNMFEPAHVQMRELFFLGKTGVDFSNYASLLNSYMNATKGASYKLTEFYLQVYDKDLPEDVSKTLDYWLEQELKLNPTPTTYAVKGISLERARDSNRAEPYYAKAVEKSTPETREFYSKNIQEYRKKVYKGHKTE